MIQCMGVEFLRECFDADFAAGLLVWRKRPRSHFASYGAWIRCNDRLAGKRAGGPHKSGYAAVWVSLNGKRHGLLVHRVLWCMRTGVWPTKTIDHKDMCRTNNKQSNLREASYSDQNANRPAIRRGLKGATFDTRTGRYVAQITRDGRNHFLGRFSSEQEAHEAYVVAASRLHSDFARAA